MPTWLLQRDPALLEGHGRSQSEHCEWQLALGLWAEMVESIVQQGTRTDNSVISASEMKGKWQLALGLLAEVPYSTAQQKTITCNASISACEKYGKCQPCWPND